jgi:isopenicillin N synthase-like dioxygenase
MQDKKAHGVSATNREYERYDQVHKQQTYRLAEDTEREEFDEEYRVRTCDIGRFLRGDAADRRAFARELGTALREIGFAILEGHGIDPAIYAEVAERTAELFTRFSLEEKLRFRAHRHGSINQGYFPIQETSDIHPDLVEGWVFCRRAFDLPGAVERREDKTPRDFWPDPALEPSLRNLCEANERLILPVMQSILLDLDVDPHLYDAKLTHTNFGLRLNYYPPLDATDAGAGGGRLLGHEDVGMFTFLPAPQIEGLQVLNRASTKWVRLDAPAGTIILNTGDYVQRITNDILPSTTHRVSKPRDPALRGVPRISFPMNVYVWEDEMLEVLPGLRDPKYPPVRAIEFHTRSTSKFYGDDYAVTE